MAARSYTDEQDALIRRLYPDTAAIVAQIPGRSRENIRRRAWRLGLATPAKAPRHRWTAAEDAVLRRLYPAVAAILRELPGMRRTQIKSRAGQLGLSQPMATWTDEEDALLRAHPRDYDTLFAMMPHRTRDAIKSRTAALGIAAGVPLWSAEEDATIREHYPDYKAIARALPERTYPALKNRARVIGLTSGAGRARGIGTARAWTEEEIAQLGTYAVKIPGRTRAAIREARIRFGVTVGNPKRISPERQAEAARRAAAWAETQRLAAERRARTEALRAERATKRAAERARRKADKERVAAEAKATREALREAARRERAARQTSRNERQRAKETKADVVRDAVRLREARALARDLARPAPAKATRRPMDGSPWPETLALAVRSRHGFELIPAIQTAARQVWPHMRGEVIDRVTRSVIAGEATLSNLAPAVAAALAAVQSRQHAA